MSAAGRQYGFTLVEASLALTLFLLLSGALASLAVKTLKSAAASDVDLSLQLEGERAVKRLTELLRKSGRSELDGVAYPRVRAGGEALQFRVLVDRDGNGYAFDEATGDLEWSNTVYTVAVDEEGTLGVRAGGTLVHHLGRHLTDPVFETVVEDPSLHLAEIRVAFSTARETRDGHAYRYDVQGSIHMRN